jgi:hypothetical protein
MEIKTIMGNGPNAKTPTRDTTYIYAAKIKT